MRFVRIRAKFSPVQKTNKKRSTWIQIFIYGLLIATFLLGSVCFAKPRLYIHSPVIVSALPLFWIQEGEYLDEAVDFEVLVSPDHQRAISLMAKGEIQMMVTGTNVGALAYNRGIDIKLLNVNIWGIDYLLTYGFTAENWRELEGKSLSLPLKGGPLDFIVRYLIQNSGADIEKIELIYIPLPQGANLFQNGKLDAIVLNEPLVTLTLRTTPEALLSIDIQKDWAKYHEGDERIPFVGLFAASSFINEQPEVVEKFNSLYFEGVKWVNQNKEEAAQLAEKYIKISPFVFEESFARTNFEYIAAKECEQKVNKYFEEILKMYPDLIGRRVPDEKFYY